MTNKLRQTVSAVIPKYLDREFFKNEYLFVKDAESGLWSHTSGKIEHGENPLLAMQRESSEEIGTMLDIKGIIGIYQFYSQHKNWVTDFTFLGYILQEPKIIRHKEIAEIKWFSLEKIYNLRRDRKLKAGKAQTTPIENLIYHNCAPWPKDLVKKSRGI